jgi:hypothetical protein
VNDALAVDVLKGCEDLVRIPEVDDEDDDNDACVLIYAEFKK